MEREEKFLENKELRDECVNHFEVLEKVKKLLLIPGTDCMNVKQVADYYGVGVEAIQSLYKDNRGELDSDGVITKSYKEFLNVLQGQLKITQGKTTVFFDNGNSIDVPRRGLKVFPRRAILRIGMLLRDSEVAKEVRSQLLNIEEKTDNITKVQDINEEQKLALSLGMAIASGDATAITVATGKMMDFKNRHINQLTKDVDVLTNGILELPNRKQLNRGVRKLSGATHIPFQNVWKELYTQLSYKYGIDLKKRGNGKTPYIQNIKEEEWDKVIKTFSAMCENYNQSPSEMFEILESVR